MEKIRSPIIATLGHVDHGKTTLLDAIRGSSVAKSEPGEITQHVGASFVPLEVIKRICGKLLEKLRATIEVPGLLFIDTPGHAAFTSLRKRGGSIADLAILVVDINEGFKEQTDESLKILREFRVPFVIAATKIDRIVGWKAKNTYSFLESFSQQDESTKEELDRKIYLLISQLLERGFEAERFDRVKDFTKQVAIVPVSGITKEGIAELLMVLIGLAQQYLKNKLKLSEMGRGNILEVKDLKGIGRTIDVILYDGSIRRGDILVIGGEKPIITKVRALLRPKPLGELRVERKFENVEEIHAAAGIKIAAPNLDEVVAGSPIVVVRNEKDIEKALEIVRKEVETVEFEKGINGVIVRADTLGSLEALIKMLREEGIPIKKAKVGPPKKDDIITLKSMEEESLRAILVFNLKVPEEIKEFAKSCGVRIFENNVIYRLIEEFKEWKKKLEEEKIKKKLEEVVRPVKLVVLPGCVFRVSKPCIVGVEVLKGVLRPGVTLKRYSDGKIVGRVKDIQKEGKSVGEVYEGEKVAMSVEGAVFGRTFKENDVLIADMSYDNIRRLRELWDYLRESEKELIEEIVKEKKYSTKI